MAREDNIKSPVLLASFFLMFVVCRIHRFDGMVIRKGNRVGDDGRVLVLTEYHEYHLGDCG